MSVAFAGGDAALQVGDLIGGEGSLAAAVGAALARETAEGIAIPEWRLAGFCFGW